jgi:outer membrane protein OmpA-like peptidoglycan-associated protein
LHLDYQLERPEIGTDLAQTLALRPIYFDLDKYNIRSDAKKELDKIIQIMNDNPNIVIELGSHTDCRSSIAYNMTLSTNRAKASAKYIQDRIINPKRIYGKGYGESQLINNCPCEGKLESTCTEEEHQANRRTEFRIVKN